MRNTDRIDPFCIDNGRIMLSEPYPELGSVLEAFVAGVQNALGKNFLGAYLVGSLATGDFDLDSDVDFLVTNGDLREQELQSLQANHMAYGQKSQTP